MDGLSAGDSHQNEAAAIILWSRAPILGARLNSKATVEEIASVAGAGRNIVIPFSLTSVCSHVAGSASKKADEGWLNKLGTNKDSSMNFLLTSQFSSIAGCQP